MTLTQVAVLTKQVIIISFLTLILGTVTFIGYKIWYAYYLAHLPPVEEKPDTKFGLLPPPDFPQAKVSSSNFSYSIDTVTGGLPKVGVDKGFDKLIKVYFVVKSFATLLSPERSQNLADKFNLKVDPQIISEVNYRFQDKDKILNVDLDSGNFTYKKEATPSGQSLEDDNKLVSDFQRILATLGALKGDFQNGRGKVILFKNNGQNLLQTDVRSEATAAQISLWPASIGNIPIETPQFNQSLINALVINSAANLDNYISLNFTYYPIDTSTFATYPIKTAAAAFEDLKSARALVVIEPEKPKVSITSVYLAYFLAENYNPYLLPIFVFEGPNFAAYVPAIVEQFQTQTK